MKKIKRFPLLMTLPILMASCAEPLQGEAKKIEALLVEDNTLNESINNLRKGFSFTGSRIQKVTDLEGKDLFQNTYSYDYAFENDENGIKTTQTYTYPYGGKSYTSSVTAVRDENGYAANEYINYKNEIDTYPILDSDSSYAYYDEYFINPFLIVGADDFKLGSESKTYSLNKDKLDIFNYYFCGNSVPLTKLTITLSDDSKTISLHEESVSFTGRTKDDETGYYKRCKWIYVGDFEIKEIATTKIASPEPSDEKEDAELSALFNSVGDNFTLSKVLYNVETMQEVGDTSVSYFDGNAYYVKSNSTDDSKVNDYLYAKDPFLESDDLYEYRYDSSSKLWLKSSNDSSSSFNITPQKKDVFIPHLKDVNVSLFTSGEDSKGYHFCKNDSAKAFMGMGFLSDAETLSYFSSGYGTDAKIKKDGDNIICLISFYYSDGTYYYEVGYKLTYSNIGSTILPEYDL